MAGEASINYGIGYSFDPSSLAPDGLELIEGAKFFDGSKLLLVHPSYDSFSARFAVLGKSTVYSGDPQEWDYSYGIQLLPKLKAEEFEAFNRLHAGLRKHYSAVAESVSELGPILSVTADM